MRLSSHIRNILAVYIFISFASVQAAELIPDNNGIDEALISSAVVNPQMPNVSFVTTEAGLYQSSDSGKTWSPFAKQPFATMDVKNIVIDPHAPSHMIVKHGYFGSTQYINDFYTTSNGGKDWEKLAPIFSQHPSKKIDINELIFCPFHQNELIAVTNSALYLSKDSGVTWSPFGNVGKIDIIDLYVSNRQPGLLFLVSWRDLYQSTDHGQSWTKMATPSIDLFGGKVVFDQHDSSIIYLVERYRVFRYNIKTKALTSVFDDGKYTFNDDSMRDYSGVIDFISLPDDRHSLLLIANGQLRLSRDGGDTWQLITNTPFSKPLSFKSSTKQGFYIYTVNGLFWSDNNAAEWYEANKGMKNIQVLSLLHDEESGDVYAGTAANLWHKSKGGQWQAVPFFSDKSILHLTHATNELGQHSIFAATPFNLYMSHDGQTWQNSLHVEGMSIGSVKTNPSNPKQIMATSGPRLAQSQDGGKTWSDWVWLEDAGLFINDIAFNPFNPQEVTLSGDTITFRSDDGGKTWHELRHPDPNQEMGLVRYTYDPYTVNQLYANKGRYPYLYKSTNGGQDFTTTGLANLTDDMYLSRLLIDSSNSSNLYAVFTHFNDDEQSPTGIYSSKDKGTSWSLLNNDDFTQFVYSTLLTPDHTLYVGTYKMGVYRMDLN